MNFTFESIPPKRILVISWRYLGDTLLLTPLLSSLKQAYPNADLDVLLPAGNVGMLENNPDIDRLIPLASKPTLLEFIGILIKIFRQYDIAISTQTSDRSTICAVFAGKCSLGAVPKKHTKGWYKRIFLDAWQEANLAQNHAVLENLRFCSLLNIPPHFKLTPPRSNNPLPCAATAPYAVIHIMPQWRYKEWHRQGWIDTGNFLLGQGFQLILTGSGQAAESLALNEIAMQLPGSLNLAGKLSLGQLTELIEQATLFVGPDTGITHLAAATGTQTIAIFGPTDPKKWSPWPRGFSENRAPFLGPGVQNVGNVYLIQGSNQKNCVPCSREGCENHRLSHSECLDNLSAETVIAVVSKIIQDSKS